MTSPAHRGRICDGAELTDIRVFVGLDYLGELKVPCNNGHLGGSGEDREMKEGGSPAQRLLLGSSQVTGTMSTGTSLLTDKRQGCQ